MERHAYSAASVSSSLWFLEFKKAVLLLDEGKTYEDIKIMSEVENIFGAVSPARAKNVYSRTIARIKSLDDSFIKLFCNMDTTTQKLIALIATMAHETLFLDFMYEVFREKLIIGSDEISKADLRVFFKEKASQDDIVAKWTDETVRRLERTYMVYLTESGVIDDNKRAEKRKIIRPIIDYDLRNWLNDFGYGIILKALEGVR